MFRIRHNRNNRHLTTLRSAGVPVRQPRPDFQPKLDELMKARWQYEAMRSSDGSLMDRAVMTTHLQELRADLARMRRDAS